MICAQFHFITLTNLVAEWNAQHELHMYKMAELTVAKRAIHPLVIFLTNDMHYQNRVDAGKAVYKRLR